MEWQSRAIQQYLRRVVRFRELLLLLIHLTAGLPARGPKILAAAYQNTEQRRNILILDETMRLLTVYHKLQWTTGQRAVARFLAPSVGDLLVNFVSLILPFAHLLAGQLGRDLSPDGSYTDEDDQESSSSNDAQSTSAPDG